MHLLRDDSAFARLVLSYVLARNTRIEEDLVDRRRQTGGGDSRFQPRNAGGSRWCHTLEGDLVREIFDHDEGNAGLEKVHCLCMSHGMGTDSHACQSGHGGCGPAQVLQQNVSSAVPAQPAAPPVLQEWLLFVELTPLGAQELSDQPCGLRQQWA